ncbi:MAG TPA: winged helix-turn-helix transcriptional regulator [Candidatus Thermoplasmatota archaeon]|nr:winged helix-turn-helix transcriptional regulator [Candidatus Thermoplasmatota archaeon]
MPPPPPTPDTVLDLEARKRIVRFVQESPGLHMRELAARLKMPVSTLEYHCYQLVKHGQLVTRESAGFKAFYPGEGMDRRDKDILYLVRHDAPRRICTHVLLNPGATPKDLRDVIGVSGPTLSFHLKKLRAAAILREEPDGRTKRLFVEDPERVANILVTYRRSFLDSAVDRFADAWLALTPPVVKKEAEPTEAKPLAFQAGEPPTPAPATEADARTGGPRIAPQEREGEGTASSPVPPPK